MKDSLRNDIEKLILGLPLSDSMLDFSVQRRKLVEDVQELVESAIEDEKGFSYARGVIAGAYVTTKEALRDHEAY